jgi:acyl-coenzyme A thioesterase PaaI-like protein
VVSWGGRSWRGLGLLFAAESKMLLDYNRPGQTLRKVWGMLHGLPLGKRLFSWIFGLCIPYTGSVSPQVLELSPGLVKIGIRDKRAVRNHLNSVHAIALANIGEAVTGLAMTLSLPDDRRAILTEINSKYLKKARGSLTAVCRFELPPDFMEGELVVESQVENAQGEVVAITRAHWKVGASR